MGTNHPAYHDTFDAVRARVGRRTTAALPRDGAPGGLTAPRPKRPTCANCEPSWSRRRATTRRGVVVFRIGISPNGALGALAGLAEDYNRRHAGRARIDYEFFDEHVREAVTPALLRALARRGGGARASASC